MGKQRRNKRAQLRPHQQGPGWEIAQIFFGAGAERLTPALIAWLVGRGWPRADLERFAAQGGMYSRPRDSIVFPPGLSF